MAVSTNNDGMCGSDPCFPLSNIKWNRKHKGFMVHFVIIHSTLVPDLIRGFVIDVGKVPAFLNT